MEHYYQNYEELGLPTSALKRLSFTPQYVETTKSIFIKKLLEQRNRLGIN